MLYYYVKGLNQYVMAVIMSKIPYSLRGLTCVRYEVEMQRRKHLRWRALQQQLTAKNHSLLLQTSSS